MLDFQGQKSPKLQQAVEAPQEIQLPLSEQRDSKPFPTSRKRKRIDNNGGLKVGEPFVIQAYPSFSSPKSQELQPILLLPRSCLSLGYLDPTAEEEDEAGSRLFSANIEVLERDAPENLSIPSTLLIVQSTANHKLWAVERVAPLLYALCSLNALATLEALENFEDTLTENECRQKGQRSVQALPLDDEWWCGATIQPRAGCQGSLSKKTNNESTTGLSLFLQKPTRGRLPRNSGLRQPSPMIVVEVKDDSKSVTETFSQRPEDVLEMVRSHYQEALYASQTPLAYFAKGPLSRARALFQSYDASVGDLSILVNFLRSSILTLAIMDTKYRDTLPNLVKDLPFTALSGDECASMAAAMGKKPRKSKKSKVGKDGLYTSEELSITRWWLSSDKSAIAGEPAEIHDGVIRRLLLEQRIRETQLQIILILETLALEASATETTPIHIPTAVPSVEGSDSQKSKRSKKPQNLETLLDLLIDRLCIWQSMDTLETKRINIDGSRSSENRTETTSRAARNDHLRQFCVDVVLPFYGARIPKITTALCQKLGGPKDPSPKRPTLVKAATAYAPPRPGAPSQREKGRRPRRTLERVMTDERSTFQRPLPSLSRSVTEPNLPQLKREKSDTSLSAIPLNRVAMHKRYSQREVDLYAASQATETKLKQKAKVEQELHSAIAALKKPNPRMAVKELVEDAEKRVAGARSRKSKNPIRIPFAQGVQVMATPSKQRHQDVFASVPRLPRGQVASRVVGQVDEVPPSSASKITDSAEKARNPSALTSDCPQQRYESILPAIEQTPSRGPSKLLGRPPTVGFSLIGNHDTSVDYPETDEAGSKPQKAAVEMFSSKSCSSDTPGTPSKARTVESNQATVQATPDKVIDSADSSKVLPAIALAPTTLRAPGESIYASLGWDDDFDELS